MRILTIILMIILLLSFSVAAELSGFSQKESYFADVNKMGLHPSNGVVENGKEFTIEVIAYPQNSLAPDNEDMNRFSRFEFEIEFDSQMLEFISSEVAQKADYGIAVPGKLDPLTLIVEPENGKAVLTYQQEYIGFPAPLRAVQTALVELTFLPLQGGDTEIVLQEGYIYSPGRGENAISTANLGNLHLTISGIAAPTSQRRGSECIPDCKNKECGSDGCGGSCEECEEGTACERNQCICVPNCQNKNCGSDGCGSSCGECLEGRICSEIGVCVPAGAEIKATTPASEVKEKSGKGPNTLFIFIGVIILILAVVIGIVYYRRLRALP